MDKKTKMKTKEKELEKEIEKAREKIIEMFCSKKNKVFSNEDFDVILWKLINKVKLKEKNEN